MSARKPIFLAFAVLLAVLGLGGGLLAQMERGDRGILPIESAGTLEVTGIHVDVGGKDANSARYAGWRIAQREGFRKLWAKMQDRPLAEAPTLPDSTLDQLVSSIIIEREQIGPTRYIADLGILFDRARAGELLGIGGEVRRSAPMLLVPILVTGGTLTSLELRNPWQRAWAQFRTSGENPIDYVRLSGMEVDPLLVNAAQARRPGRGWWRNIIDLYDAADILVAEAQVHRAFPGGPAVARFIARHGPDGEILGGFSLTAKDSAAVSRMMTEGVRRIDQIFATALAVGRLERDPTLIAEAPPLLEVEALEEAVEKSTAPLYPLQFYTPDQARVLAVVALVRGLPGVESVSESSIAIGSWSVLSVRYRGEAGGLAATLAAAGWKTDMWGRGVRIQRLMGATPIPAPAAPQPADEPTPPPFAPPPPMLPEPEP